MIRDFGWCNGGRYVQRILIAGGWVEPEAGVDREILNPATRKPLGSVRDCGREDVERCVAAARSALPAWQAVTSEARAALLDDVAVRIRAHKAEIAGLATRESGVPLCESADCIEAAAYSFERFAALVRAGEAGVVRELVAPGAVAVILPANFSLLALGAAVAPALASGATLVLKPPAGNPLSSLALAESFAALPSGVVNVLTGGSPTAASLAERLPTRTFDEPLGTHAFVVCRDADLELGVPGIAWERLRHGGQILASPSHIFVERSIAAELADRMHQCIGFLDVDDPVKRPTDLGPLISLEAAQNVEDQVGRVLRAGARLILGGRRFKPSGLPGHFFQPTLLMLPEGAPLPEAISGPVITMTPVRDLAEGLGSALQSGGDSSVSIYTRDVDAAVALTRASCGTFRINDPPLPGAAGPFGAIRHPVIRAALGAPRGDAEALEISATVERKSWWFPYADRPRS
jgi:succinate-semialdehyde dehydrogenase / glutarate-semialdehyde dehydrogenase